MSFFDRTYSVFLLLPSTHAPKLWQSQTWCEFAKTLGPYALTKRGKPSVRSDQYGPGRKPIAFGRLGWDEKSHSKWTHADTARADRQFLSVEAWAPSWNQSVRDNLAPDFFVAVMNESAFGQTGRALRFGQRIICAMCDDSSHCLALEAALAGWAKKLDAQVFAKQRRPWGFDAGAGGFSGAVQDLIYTGLFRPGSPHEHADVADRLAERWHVLNAV